MALLVFALLLLLPVSAWSLTYGVVNEPTTTVGDIFLDDQLSADCPGGNYSRANRNCTGADGEGYNDIASAISNLGPGQTLLVRGGLHSTSNLINPTAGTSEAQRRTVRRYGSENAIIQGPWELSSFLTIAGMEIRGPTSGESMVITEAGSTNVIVRNNFLNAGNAVYNLSVMRLGCLPNSLFEGNDIMGPGNRDMIATGCVRNITFRRNRWEMPAASTGDFVALNGPFTANGTVMIFEENWFVSSGTGGEEYMDFKQNGEGTTGGIIVRRNFFDGTGIAAEKACLRVVGRLPGTAFTVTIDSNVFYRCETPGSTRGLALVSDQNVDIPGANWNNGQGLTVQNNLFYCDAPNSAAGALLIGLDGVTFLHNTIVRCNISIQENSFNPSVDGITWRSNLLYDMNWGGDVMSTTGVTCTHNTWFSLGGQPPWFGQCTNNRTDDPGFVDIVTSGTINLNITDAGDQTAHDTGVRGALQAPACTACNVGNVSSLQNTLTWSGTSSPINVLNLSRIITLVNDLARSNTTHQESGLSTLVTFGGAVVVPNDDVLVRLQQGAVENAQCLGGPEICYNGENAPTTIDVACSNTTSPTTIYGPDNESVVTVGDLYLDINLPAGGCNGNYSIANRACNGANGNARRTLDELETFPFGTGIRTVLCRDGTYSASNWSMQARTSEANRLTVKRFGTETCTISNTEIRGANFVTMAGLNMPTSPVVVIPGSQAHSMILRNNNLRRVEGNDSIATNVVITGNSIQTIAGDLRGTVHLNGIQNTNWLIDNNLLDMPPGNGQGDCVNATGWDAALTIRNNHFERCAFRHAIQLQMSSATSDSRFTVENNFIDGAASPQACVLVRPGAQGDDKSGIIRNNAIMNCAVQSLIFRDDLGAPAFDAPITAEHNLIVGTAGESIAVESSNITIRRNTTVGQDFDIGGDSTPLAGTVHLVDNLFQNGSFSIAAGTLGVCSGNNDDNVAGTLPASCTGTTFVASGFVSPALRNYNSVQPTLAGKGALKQPTVDECGVGGAGGTTNVTSWNVDDPPVVTLMQTNIITKVNTVARTTTSNSVVNQFQINAVFGVPAVVAGQSVDLQLLQGAVSNSQCLGGIGLCSNGENVATVSDIVCVNTIGAAPVISGFVESFPWSCNRYASPTGTGTACTSGAPCTIEQAENAAQCGQVVCLLSGTYAGTNQVINLTGRTCSASSPLVIRAIHDGQVLIDGQNARIPINHDASSSGVVIAGINATRSSGAIADIRGGEATLYRVVGYDNEAAPIFQTDGVMARGPSEINQSGDSTAHNILFDQTVAFGPFHTGYFISEAEQVSVRNSFGRYRCTTSTQPKNVIASHHVKDSRYEDNIATWAEELSDCAAASVTQKTRFVGHELEERWATDELHQEFLGNVILIEQIDSGVASFGFRYNQERFATFKHNAGWIQPGASHAAVNLFDLGNSDVTCGPGTAVGACNFFAENNTAVHNGTAPTFAADWVSAANEVDASPRETSTNVWATDSVGANLCQKFVNGLRAGPRWPHPMNQRTIDAMTTYGIPPYDITAKIETAFGAIPAECKNTSAQSDIALQ